MTWTSADSAEQDVLIDELARAFTEHRQECEACQPCPQVAAWKEHRAGCWKCRNTIRFTTTSYGEPCPHYIAHLAHGRTCKPCNPCPQLHIAIDVVLEWRRHRELLSRAQALRISRDLIDQQSHQRNAAA